MVESDYSDMFYMYANLQGVHTVTFEIKCDVIEERVDEWVQVCLHCHDYIITVVTNIHHNHNTHKHPNLLIILFLF